MLTCSQSPPGQLLLAIRQFNNHEWFECHETLEELWLAETGEVRDFLQGVLQIAVALHHWRNGNRGGAISLLATGAAYLEKVADICLWVNVAALIADSNRLRFALQECDAESMAHIDQSLIPAIRTVSCT